MLARLSAFVIWGAVAAGAVFWSLRLGVDAPRAPAFTAPVDVAAAGRADWSRVLGVAPTAAEPDDEPAASDPVLASRFRLLGVVAPKLPARPEGVALIAVDDGPPRAYRVGAVVDGNTVLQSVHGFGAELGPRGGAAEVRLQLPPMPPPATGVPSAVGAPAAAVPRSAPGFPLLRPPPPQAVPVDVPPDVEPADQGLPEN